MPKIKLTGNRSLKSKLRRMSAELADDAGRVEAGYDTPALVSSLADISRQLGALARLLED